MGFDQRALQLLLNVVAITGVTSMALMWHLRRRDNKKLQVNLSLQKQQGPFVPVPAQTDHGPKELGGESEGCATRNTTPGGDQDIRQYVARRSREWASAAKTS